MRSAEGFSRAAHRVMFLVGHLAITAYELSMAKAKAPDRRILDLPIKRVFFDRIRAGTKTEEFRDRTDFWKSRLEGREYDEIRFRAGYQSDSPIMYIEFKGVKKPPRENYYAIQLGKILRTENCK